MEAWIGLQPPLDPRRLVPALLRCAEAGAGSSMRQEAIRYVDFCIRQLDSTEPAIHNLAVRPLLSPTTTRALSKGLLPSTTRAAMKLIPLLAPAGLGLNAGALSCICEHVAAGPFSLMTK